MAGGTLPRLMSAQATSSGDRGGFSKVPLGPGGGREQVPHLAEAELPAGRRLLQLFHMALLHRYRH